MPILTFWLQTQGSWPPLSSVPITDKDTFAAVSPPSWCKNLTVVEIWEEEQPPPSYIQTCSPFASKTEGKVKPQTLQNPRASDVSGESFVPSLSGPSWPPSCLMGLGKRRCYKTGHGLDQYDFLFPPRQ
jgi:hypothetical protein